MAAVLIDEHVALARVHGYLGQDRPRPPWAKTLIICKRGAVQIDACTPAHVYGSRMFESEQRVALYDVYERRPA